MASASLVSTLESKLQSLLNLDTSTGTGIVQAEYVFIGGSGHDLRNKSRTLLGVKAPITDARILPVWNYDGSETGQAYGEDSEVYLYPRRVFKDPFRGGDNILVMCDCYDPKYKLPVNSNTRASARDIFKKLEDAEPWFGIEQSYTLFDLERWPLGWPRGALGHGFPTKGVSSYCGAGSDQVAGRAVADAHYKACLYAGINISGIFPDAMPGQWVYTVGPCVGIDAGDQLWMARYIMTRVCEMAGAICSLDPKPIPGADWNGGGCHINFSTRQMREENGAEVIKTAIFRLGAKHPEHMILCGVGNERRGDSTTEPFSWGVANSSASILVNRDTVKNNKGYFEDRRPAANMEPYEVTAKMAETCVLYEGDAPPIEEKKFSHEVRAELHAHGSSRRTSTASGAGGKGHAPLRRSDSNVGSGGAYAPMPNRSNSAIHE